MAETDFIPTEEDKKFDTAPSLEKCKIELTSKELLHDAVAKAVDYRGDITIGLKDGSEVVGYIFSQNAKCAEPYIELYPANKDEKLKIPYSNLKHFFFSGIDTASGRSWAAWLAKYKEREAKGLVKE